MFRQQDALPTQQSPHRTPGAAAAQWHLPAVAGDSDHWRTQCNPAGGDKGGKAEIEPAHRSRSTCDAQGQTWGVHYNLHKYLGHLAGRTGPNEQVCQASGFGSSLPNALLVLLLSGQIPFCFLCRFFFIYMAFTC
jgi:hypothetical protein